MATTPEPAGAAPAPRRSRRLLWRGLGALGGAGASGCGLEYRGQPNAIMSGLGASGGDIDLASLYDRNLISGVVAADH